VEPVEHELAKDELDVATFLQFTYVIRKTVESSQCILLSSIEVWKTT